MSDIIFKQISFCNFNKLLQIILKTYLKSAEINGTYSLPLTVLVLFSTIISSSVYPAPPPPRAGLPSSSARLRLPRGLTIFLGCTEVVDGLFLIASALSNASIVNFVNFS